MDQATDESSGPNQLKWIALGRGHHNALRPKQNLGCKGSCFCLINYVFIVVVMCDLEHDVENIHGLCQLLTASWNSFLRYECCSANCDLQCPRHLSCFGRGLLLLLSVKTGHHIVHEVTHRNNNNK